MARTCIDCGTSFEPTGHACRCKTCRRVWDTAWRLRRKEGGHPVVSVKMDGDYFSVYYKKYYLDEVVKARCAANQRRYVKDAQLRPRYEARWIAKRAIKYGRLIKNPCEKCGGLKVDAHHDDYSRPLDVRWLCRKHHIEHHVDLRGMSFTGESPKAEAL